MAQGAAGVALGCLRLAIPRKVIGPTTLVTRCAVIGRIAVSGSGHAATAAGSAAIIHAVTGAIASNVVTTIAVVARLHTRKRPRAFRRDVSHALAVVALLRDVGALSRAILRLMARLLAVIAKPLDRVTIFSIVAYVPALVAGLPLTRRDSVWRGLAHETSRCHIHDWKSCTRQFV